MSNLNLSKKLIPAPLPPFEHPDAGLSRDELLKIMREIEAPAAPEDVVNFDEEIDALERITEELRRMSEWLGFTDVCEPATQAALAYGDADLAQEKPDSSKTNLEFGSAAWFAGINPIPFTSD